jgi:phosphate-selective porin OprO and OprP
MYKDNLKWLLTTLISLTSITATSAHAQNVSTQSVSASPPPFAIKVPEWKSRDGKAIVRLRARAVHDFYSVNADLGGTTGDVTSDGDGLRALRVGLDGQFSPKVRFRADANLTDSNINWVDVYLGYVGPKYEFYVGQHRQSTTFETVGPDVNYALTETALVNTAFGQSARSFGIAARVKGQNWQTIAGLYSGNINDGDVFGNDALQYAQVRSTYAFRNKERDVLHLGGSLRLRDTQQGTRLRYSARAASTNFGPRLIDTGTIATQDSTFSLEGLLIQGPLIVVGEYQLLQADTPNFGTIALQGGYLESSWWLTGESRRYQVATGTVGQVKPMRALGAGGYGALAVVGRVEHLDLSDHALGTRAGTLNSLSLGLAWIPIEYVMLRLTASQNHVDRPLATQSGDARVIMARAQIAF